MFRFLFGSRKPKPQNNTAVTAVAPGTRIHYRADLIDELRRDHQNLLNLYTLIAELTRTEDYELAEARLGDFRNLLQKHLLTEKIHLYIYLEHLWLRESKQYATMHNYRYEMEGIGKTVMGFLRKYSNFSADPRLIKPFKADLAKIGEVLGNRIEAEETNLYPLYRESS